MPHAAIHPKGSDKILNFITDCVQRGADFTGSRGKVLGANMDKFAVRWTEDTAAWDPDTKGWDKTVGELRPCEPGAIVHKPAKAAIEDAIRRRADLGAMTYDELDAYIDKHVKGMADVREYLKTLSRAVLATITIQNRGI